MRARLTIEAGEGHPSTCDLTCDAGVTVGRHRTNGLVIQDKHASRHHAEIARQNGHWLLRDSGTLNGTRLNGTRIGQPVPLADGDVIAIGDVRLRFSIVEMLDGEEVTPPLVLPPEPRSTTPLSIDLAQTSWHKDELAALCGFMAASVEETS